ncbi:MAG TPA: hypothetical protein PLG50_11755 [bacterium]|nr:hypothetical protein [bacterium]HQG46323.1 hypothetical protein [bacterium]HQI48256.1 hypothetical protein [bacterium]HQJ65988.1 hypothetical protein [bacterium]
MPRTRKTLSTAIPYFLTCTVVGWIPIFTNPVIVKITIDVLAACQIEHGLCPHGYVIMKGHLHLIARHENLSKLIHQFKSSTASCYLRYYYWHNKMAILERFAEGNKARLRDKSHQIWQADSRLEEITHEAVFL